MDAQKYQSKYIKSDIGQGWDLCKKDYYNCPVHPSEFRKSKLHRFIANHPSNTNL